MSRVRISLAIVGWTAALMSGVGDGRSAISKGDIEGQSPEVRVWAIDQSRLGEKKLFKALDGAARIFRSAGLRMVWGTCPSRTDQPGESARCHNEDASALILQIVTRPAADFTDGDALGFAIVTSNSRYATVFRERVLATAYPRRWSESMLLGYAIAHELGHLLLGTPTHSQDGLMAARWNAADLDQAASGLLQFSPAEAARMRAESIRRGLGAGASGTPNPDVSSQVGSLSFQGEGGLRDGVLRSLERQGSPSPDDAQGSLRMRAAGPPRQLTNDKLPGEEPRSAQVLPADLVNAETQADGNDHRTTKRQMPAIRVWVMDAVQLEERTLAAALDKAQVIFGDAGVRVIWLRCPAEAKQAAQPGPCQADDTNKLFLRIVRQPVSGFGSQHALGQAFSGGAGSQYATVFHDRVLALAASRKPGSEALVLGHVMAHELGHLMLGTSAHASFGLMAAGWSAADLERAPAGLLEFSSAEAAIIRAEALRRAQQPPKR